MEEIGDLLAALSCVVRTDLIGYHTYGAVKYEETGLIYGMDASPVSQAEMEALRDSFARRGASVQLGG